MARITEGTVILLGRSGDEILNEAARYCPEVHVVLDAVRADIPQSKREIARYQAAVLYALAKRFDREGARFLEIGTALGYSAATIARAAPLARITTLNPKEGEWQRARESLDRPEYANVRVIPAYSWDYLEECPEDARFDFIFVDGDHGYVARDFAWWWRLAAGGLMLFHDYTPAGVKRSCRPVYEALDALKAALKREFDVLIVDERGIGMAGFYRGAGEPLPKLRIENLLWDFNGQGWVRRRGR